MKATKGRRSSGPMVDALTALHKRRWLLWYFVRRQISRSYRTTFLGVVWVFLGPLLMVILFTAVFSEILGIRFREAGGSVTNFGLYLYCGLIPFLAYGQTVNQGLRSIRSNRTLVKKVIFPLEVLPISGASAAVMTQLFGVAALLLLTLIIERQFHWTVVLLPLVMVPQLLFMLGLSFLSAVAGTYLPDLREAMNAVVRASFFVTPIIWPPEMAPESLRWLVSYNPLAYLVGAYRALVLEGEATPNLPTLYFALFSAGLCLLGFAIFVRAKYNFADLL